MYEDKPGEWRWRLVARNGKIIADSGEGYTNSRDCIKGIRMVQSYAPKAPIDGIPQGVLANALRSRPQNTLIGQLGQAPTLGGGPLKPYGSS